MASKKFRSVSGGHVSIYVPWRETPIEVGEGGVYETDDKRELEALQGSSEIVEEKQSAKKDDAPAKGESKK